MTKKHLLSAGVLAAALLVPTVLLISGRASAAPLTGQAKSAFNTKPVGKISPWEAMSIAAKASGGRPFQAMYEFDDGQWIYGVVVVKNHKLMEVELDPTTGKVGETEQITPSGEAKELTSDLTKAMSGN